MGLEVSVLGLRWSGLVEALGGILQEFEFLKSVIRVDNLVCRSRVQFLGLRESHYGQRIMVVNPRKTTCGSRNAK